MNPLDYLDALIRAHPVKATTLVILLLITTLALLITTLDTILN